MDLVVPVKSLRLAKSRLRGAAGRSDAAHAELVLAMVTDTVLAAGATPGVRDVLVVSGDARVNSALRAKGITVSGEGPVPELNAAYRHGEAVLGRSSDRVIAALQADLPALRPAELGAALAEAAGGRAFCPDRQGTGTTLLVAAAGHALDPRFGPGSARAHLESGARLLDLDTPSLRCDVDTAEDLSYAAGLGLGPHTRELLNTPSYAG
ncbi:MAG: 2-phospho-L-lactate guanylyltransferase [Pseudonocardiaceae bacterium]|nr:2-phospho-L-lactate guanylyltransferase [Pseudonocardiaceae bacterium]